MKCPRCQQENEAGAKFCEECAAPLARTCGNCGRQLSATAKFCPECAHPASPAAPVPTVQRFISPESYTPKHLAEKILTSKGALEGERKQVTVLFADLKGSMELLADRDPEEARKLLDPVLEHMMEAVHRYEGTVNQVMGDGIMALFGAPLAHEDHAVRACYAALRMQETVKQYANEVRRTRGVTVRIRIGLNSGDVVVRAVGSDLRMDYTAVGQTTHLAARMEQLADPGSILLSADTLELAEGQIQVKSHGPMPIKGLAEPVEVYEVLAASTVRSRFQAAAARGLTAFVGRAAEIEQLYQALDHAKAGRGQVIAVVGEPGVGKSRLYHEFTHSHRVQDCFVIASTSVSYGRAASYYPLVDLLRTYFRIEGRDDARLIREKVTGRLLSLDRALEPFLTAMLWLLDVSVDDPQWDRLDPPQRRQQILDGVKRLLLRESQAQPVVVVFEDLHWIDAETQALVDALVESLPAARVLMLVNYRPEYRHSWGSKTYYRQLRIDPLPVANAYQLLDSLLGNDPTVGPLKTLLVQRTEGTPFFLEEGVRTLVETKVLLGDRGSYRLLKSVDAIEVPATVKALLAARIDRLGPEEKAVLQAASVIGTDVPFEVLQAIADIPAAELRGRLAQLQAAEFLYEVKIFPDLEYMFKHALTHEVAYGSLLGDRRRSLHSRIVEAIERLYADRLGEQIERLAYHAVRSEVPSKAVPYLHEAGTRAAQRSANGEAVTYLRQGLDLVAKLPCDREQMRLELRLLLALGPPLQQMQGYGVADVETTYARARQLCEQVGEPFELFQALWGFWLYTLGNARLSEGRRIAEELLSIAERLGDRALLLEARHALSPTTLWIGDPVAARQHSEHGMALYDQEQHRSLAFLYGGHDPGVCCQMHSALALWMLGYPAASLDRGRNGMMLARHLSHPISMVTAIPFLGAVHQLRGEVAPVHELAATMIEVATGHGLAQWLVFGRVLEAWVHAERGDGEVGVAKLQGAVDEYRSKGNYAWLPFMTLLSATACLKHGAVDQGLTIVSDTLEKANETGVRSWDAEFYRLRGELLLARDPTDADAESAFHRAIDTARAQNAKSWELRAALSLSLLWRGHGKRDEASQFLSGIYGWFTEGFDTPDLRAAKALLDELSAASK
jgi:class 3 adenylate cyclase/predicted ATPase